MPQNTEISTSNCKYLRVQGSQSITPLDERLVSHSLLGQLLACH